MLYYTINEVNDRVLRTLVSKHKSRLSGYQEDWDIYQNDTKIVHDFVTGKSKELIRAPYASYATDFYVNYILGNPVTYTCENKEMLDKYNETLDNNKEDWNNKQIATRMGAQGECFEVVYVDENKQPRFKYVPADEMCVIYNTELDPKMILAFRYYVSRDLVTNKDVQYLEVYTDKEVIYYSMAGNRLQEYKRVFHLFGEIPVVHYKNNEECKCDFHKVKSQIKAYSMRMTNNSEEIDYCKNAYLVVSGIDLNQRFYYKEEDRYDPNKADNPQYYETGYDQIKRLGIINIPNPEQGVNYKFEFVTKDVNDAFIENELNRLNGDIMKFLGVPDLTDESFAGNSSGVALDQKFLGLEQKVAEKRIHLRDGFLKRCRLICNYLNSAKMANIDYKLFDVVFSTNKPIDETAKIDNAEKLIDMGIDKSVATSQIPGVDDTNAITNSTNVKDNKKQK